MNRGAGTEQRLQRGAALLQAISGVRRWEEDGGRESDAGDIQPEAHGSQQGLPPGDPPNLT